MTAAVKTPHRDLSAASLSEYLSSRRAAVQPATSGVTVKGFRRVSGLRREEVAALAAVSVDYYMRLEQGREVRPSPQVLEGLVRALQLGEDARLHLYRLAGASPATSALVHTRDVSPELMCLLDDLRESPALVLNSALDVLARNNLCQALHSGFSIRDNSARMAFLDPLGRTFYADWELAAETTVASLRLAAGIAPRDVRVVELVDELSAYSDAFRALWARNVVRAKTSEIKRYNHPTVGHLMFSYQSFDVRGVPGQQLVIFGRVPGDTSSLLLSDRRSVLVTERW